MPYQDYDPDDPDAPQPMDLDGDDTADDEDDDDTVQCAACGRWLHATAAVCPHCGEWLEDESPAASRSRGWFWPLMVSLLILVILVVWAGLRL